MMKIPKGGVFGGLVVALVISASIGATYLMNVETHQETAIEYDYITNISSLFDYDKNPQYYEYDLSKNYTGYYTALTDPYWGGVEYTQSTRINNYRLNLEPESTTTITTDLSTDYGAGVYTNGQVMVFGDDGVVITAGNNPNNIYKWENNSTGVSSVLLSTLMTDQSLTDDIVTFIQTTSDVENRVLITSTDNIIHEGSWDVGGFVSYDKKNDWTEWYYGGSWHPMAVATWSAVYDKLTEQVDLYYSLDASEGTFYASIPLSKCVVIFGGTNASAYYPLGTDLVITSEVRPPVQYLDINKGVRVIGA